MGTISLPYTFVAGQTPTQTQWNANPATIATLVNGQIDKANVDSSGSDGIVTMDETQAISGPKTFSGVTTMTGTLTVGVDGTGVDVKFFGAAAGAFSLWDESANKQIIQGATAAGPGALTLATGELTVVNTNRLGQIDFVAPLESSGTDAIVAGASIWAEATDTFAADNNTTDLVFAAATSEAAAARMRMKKGSLVPQTTDTMSLGTSTLNWSDLFLDSGGVINFNSGDVTVTHASNLLTVGGGDLHVANGQGLVVGHTAQVTSPTAAELQLLGTVGADSTMIIGRWAASGGSGALDFVKSRHATIGSFAPVVNGDDLGQVVWYGDDGNSMSATARVLVEVDGSVSDGVVPSRMIFATSTTDDLTERVRIDSAGKIFTGGASANAFSSAGSLSLYQAANDNEILTLKSNDVTHGVTTDTDTDTYGLMQKAAGTAGGLQVEGYTEGTAAIIGSATSTADNTTKGTGARAVYEWYAAKKNGTTKGNVGADGNMAMWAQNDGTVRFIFDAEGSGHADVEWTTYDKHDDIALINDMESELLLNEDEAQTDRRHALEATGIIGEGSWHTENGKPRAMVNFTKLSMLHHGALIQMGQVYEALMKRLELAEGKLKMLEA